VGTFDAAFWFAFKIHFGLKNVTLNVSIKALKCTKFQNFKFIYSSSSQHRVADADLSSMLPIPREIRTIAEVVVLKVHFAFENMDDYHQELQNGLDFI
jgi:hypothetical protein